MSSRPGGIRDAARPGPPALGGVQLRSDRRGATGTAYTTIGTPIYDAGIDRGDRIVSLDGRRVRSADDVDAVLRGRRVGGRIRVVYQSRDGERTSEITLAESSALEVVTFEAAGLAVDAEIRRFREDWLEPKGR